MIPCSPQTIPSFGKPAFPMFVMRCEVPRMGRCRDVQPQPGDLTTHGLQAANKGNKKCPPFCGSDMDSYDRTPSPTICGFGFQPAQQQTENGTCHTLSCKYKGTLVKCQRTLNRPVHENTRSQSPETCPSNVSMRLITTPKA